ncbi:hypothetical protein FOQG_17558 [Fusarium oxysporum f. sp. raphani 54005]|uniref:Uncharacterized protein n=1 Tax=Fusarium oxysporum f. sp. raphani 54005 TaxID=1089458 RepID=X0BFY1_FUSOX|nr:hypothetical protein FOQG_17558 [Fusarium oxysporum f. sp. raphani 54005]
MKCIGWSGCTKSKDSQRDFEWQEHDIRDRVVPLGMEENFSLVSYTCRATVSYLYGTHNADEKAIRSNVLRVLICDGKIGRYGFKEKEEDFIPHNFSSGQGEWLAGTQYACHLTKALRIFSTNGLLNYWQSGTLQNCVFIPRHLGCADAEAEMGRVLS